MSDEIEEVDYEELGMDEDELTSDLFLHIDHEKKIVKATHSFEDKIAALDLVIDQFAMNYDYNEDLNDFIEDIKIRIDKMLKSLRLLKNNTIHLLVNLEATQKSGKKWIIRNAKKVEEEIEEIEKVSKRLLQIISLYLKNIKRLFTKAKHIFEVEIEKAQVKSLKIKLEEGEEEVLDILDKLLKFFIVYEHFFEQELKELK